MKNISPQSKKILIIVARLIIALIIFEVGVLVGYRKAEFSFRFGDRYYQTFEENHNESPLSFFDKDFTNGSGAVGKIVNIASTTIIVATPENLEKNIRVTDDTMIREFRNNISINDLKIGDHIVVLGSSNDKSEIEAKLIRVLPPPPSDTASTSTNPNPSQKI